MADKKMRLKKKEAGVLNQIMLETLASLVIMADSATVQAAIDAIKSGVLYKTGGTMTGPLILSGDPTQALGAATKQYVDAAAEGLTIKRACRVATTTNITLSGLQAIDGITVVANDRVLVKEQTNKSQNGIYVASASAWARASDFNSSANIVTNAFTFVSVGSTQADTGWTLITDPPINVGTTLLEFTQFSGAGQIVAGTGLNKTGNTISMTNVGTPGTYKSVSTDAQGRVTSGSNPTTLSGFGITDAVPSSDVVTTATANKILKLDHLAQFPNTIIPQDATHRFVSELQIISWDGKARITQGVTPPADLANGEFFLEEIQ